MAWNLSFDDFFAARIHCAWLMDMRYTLVVYFYSPEEPAEIAIKWEMNPSPPSGQLVVLPATDTSLWEKMDFEEKLICALSSNLTQINLQKHDSLNPAGRYSYAPSKKSIEILRDSWSITTASEL